MSYTTVNSLILVLNVGISALEGNAVIAISGDSGDALD